MHMMPQRPAAKRVIFSPATRQRLLAGVRAFSKTVCVTLGPHGRTVMLDRAAGLLATKDGVTVAREIDLADPVANMACQALKEACIKVNNEAGDGTTSAACIAAAILEEGCKLAAADFNPVHMARGIQKASLVATSAIRDLARPAEAQRELVQVALIASNGDLDVAEKLAEAVMAVGKNGTVSIEDGKSTETILIFKEGMEIDRGAASMHFLGSSTERVMDGPLVACVAATLRTVEDVQDLLETASQWKPRPILVFADAIEGEALKVMTVNHSQGVVDCCAIPAPGFHDKKADYLGDIAALAGATLIDPRQGMGWKDWNPEWFGAFRQVIVRQKASTLVAYDEASEGIRDRIDQVKAQARFATSQYDTDRINERIAALEGGLCIMQIGAATEAELKEKRARVEDALGAVQGALEEGIVPGGGTAYLAAYQALVNTPPPESVEEKAGWDALTKALLAPTQTLANNAGKTGSFLVHQVLGQRDGLSTSWIGWDAVRDEIRNLHEGAMVIDPARVTIAVVEAAASSAATLLTSEASISSV